MHKLTSQSFSGIRNAELKAVTGTVKYIQQCCHLYTEQDGTPALPTSMSARPDHLCKDCGDVQEEVVQQRGLFYFLDHCTTKFLWRMVYITSQHNHVLPVFSSLPLLTYCPLTYSTLASLSQNFIIPVMLTNSPRSL